MTSDDRIEIEAIERRLAGLGVRFSKVLHHANGAPRAYMAKLRGAIYEDDGTKVVDVITDFDTLVRQYRFSSTLPGDGGGGAVITCVWIVPDAAPVPPAFILTGMKEEVVAGNALVLLANDRAALDQARAAISVLLAGEPRGCAR